MKRAVTIFLILFPLLLLSFNGSAGTIKADEALQKALKKSPAKTAAQNTVKFTENKKQWDEKVLYRAQLDGGVLFLEKNCFTYNFYDKETLRENHLGKNVKEIPGLPNGEKRLAPIRSHAFRMTFLNAETTVKTSAQQVSSDYCNFFIGNDKNKWAGNVKNYKEINYKTIYNKIDLQVLGLQNSMKYNFIVAPHGNPDNIQLFYEGLDSISPEKGAMKLKTSLNEMVEQRPYAYQFIGGKRVEVPCEFILKNTTVSFNFPRGYNKEVELVIDPVLVFACSSGSLADNFGMTATYDSQGNLYAGGTVFGAGYPTTLGAYDTTWNGGPSYIGGRTDVVITKYDSSGTFLIYSTYLGGTVSTEIVSSLIVNSQNELMLYGATGSSDFPVTAGAYDVTFNGGSYLSFPANGTEYLSGTDIYASKFNSTGTSLLASTFIGGTQNDGVNNSAALVYNYGDYYRGEIQVDNQGNFYIASYTNSTNFPTTPGCLQPTSGGGMDGVVFKLDPNLSTMIWSTYIGGSADDGCYALALDDSSNVYTTGGTASINFPITAGALSTTYNGGITDGFVSKIKNNGSAILKSTYIGTNLYDQSFFIQLDKSFDVYILGQTKGVMPVSGGVYSNPNSKQFIWKLNNSLSAQVFTTVFGNGNGNINISPSAFLVDYCENIYVSGWGGHILQGTPTFNMPLTGNAFQSSNPDGYNFYLFVLSTNAASLLYASYFGGAQSQEHVDGGTSRFDKKGIVYQAVCANCGGWDASTQHNDFPVTPGSWPNTGADVNHNTQNYNCNMGVFKFDFQVPIVSANFIVNYTSGCSPVTVTFDNQSSSGSEFLWDFGSNDTTSLIVNPTRTYTTPGTYLVQLYVKDPTTCNVNDTAYQYITVYPPVAADFGFVIAPCSNLVTFSDSSASAPVSWHWQFDDGNSSVVQNPLHTYSAPGIYDVQLIASTIDGCKDTAVFQVNLDTAASIPLQIPSCLGFPSNFTQSSVHANSYHWDFGDPGTSLDTSNVLSPSWTYANAGTYTVTLIVNPGTLCSDTAAILTTVNPLPAVTSSAVSTICSGGTVSIPLTGSLGSTFTWIAANNVNTTGESITIQSGSALSNTITNNTTAVQTVTYTVTPTSSPQGCAGTQQTVTVTINPAPAMTSPASATICNGGTVNIPLTSSMASTFTWIAANNANTTGESTTLQSGSPLNNTLTNTSSSLQSVIYTVTPTLISGTCPGIPQTVTVTVIPTPAMTSLAAAAICNGGTVNIPLTSNVISTYSWIASDNINTTGESLTIQTGSPLNNTLTNNTASAEPVSYTVTPVSSPDGCAGTPQTVVVSVNPSPTMTSIPYDTICNGETANIPLTSDLTSVYNWIAADNPNTSGESTTTQTGSLLSNTIFDNTASVQTVIYTVTPTTSPQGCAGAPQTIMVTVNPSPTMTSAGSAVICNGDTVNIALTSSMASTYTWIAADNANTTGESTTLQTGSPINDTITNTSASVQLVTYTVTPSLISGTCAGIPQTITVTVIPPPTVTSPTSASICSGGIISIPLTSSITSNFSWIAADNANTTGESTTAQSGSPITDTIINNTSSVQTVSYTVTPTSSPQGCAGTPQTLTVTVYNGITADFDFATVPCTNQVTFYDSSAVGPVSWLWHFDDGGSSVLQNPQHTYASIGTYNVQLITSTINGCSDTVVVQADFAALNPILISANDTICKGSSTNLSASGGLSYLWSPAQSLSNAAISNPIANPDTTTTYTVTIQTVNALNDTCVQILTTTVYVIDPLLYSISATIDNDTIVQGQSTVMHAITDPSLTVNWTPSAGLSSSHSFNPVVTPESTTTYTVSILDSVGCPKTASIKVYVMSMKCNPADIFVPNTFTPNGDGNNDVLYIHGNEITQMNFAVYNRWGEAVFQTSDMTKGWDGTYNGMKVDPAVFGWYIKGKCYSGEEFRKQGNVTLIR